MAAKVSLAGSVPTGRKVLALAGGLMKHATMEIGGKSPLIVFDDADPENAIGGAMLGNFYSNGQVCSNGTRVFVQSAIHDRFVERLTEGTKTIGIGDPLRFGLPARPDESGRTPEPVFRIMKRQARVETRSRLAAGLPVAPAATLQRGDTEPDSSCAT